MNAIFKRARICGLAALALSILMASSTLAGAGSSVSRTYGGPPSTVSPNPTRAGSVGTPRPPCGWYEPRCSPPVGVVKGTNKGTCKPNGEGCYRQY